MGQPLLWTKRMTIRISVGRRLAAFCAGLFCLCMFGSSAALDAQFDPWKDEIDRMLAADAAHAPVQDGVLFIGSSSIRLWTTLARDFPGIPVVNRGFGGSMLADATRNVGRLVTPFHPRVVVIYAGDNDIAAKRSPSQVLADFKEFVARVRRDSPRIPVLYLAIKPSVARFALWPKMREANESIAAWARTRRDVLVVDATKSMLDAAGQPRPELFENDGLHMRAAGYALWIDALAPVLARHGFVASSRRAHP